MGFNETVDPMETTGEGAGRYACATNGSGGASPSPAGEGAGRYGTQASGGAPGTHPAEWDVDSADNPGRGSAMFEKLTPEERRKINQAIVDHSQPTYRRLYERFNLLAKGIHFFAFYRYARTLRAQAELAMVAELIAPNPGDIPKIMQRLAGAECIAAMLHPEETGSGKRLARYERVHARLRRDELLAQRTAATIEVARIRADAQLDVARIRGDAQRDCTAMRSDAQKDVTSIRAEKANHMNERRIKTQRDIVQFRADVMAARHNALYPGPETPPPTSDSTPPTAPTESVICSERFSNSAEHMTTTVKDAIPGGDSPFDPPPFKRCSHSASSARQEPRPPEPRISEACTPQSDIPHPTSDIPRHPAFAGDAAPFGRRPDGTKRSHLEYWIRLKQRCREILKMPAEDPDWPPDIRAALALRPPELAAQRLRDVLKRYPRAPTSGESSASAAPADKERRVSESI